MTNWKEVIYAMMMAALRANELANERRKTYETERSNRARERETERANRASEYEKHRSNVANETRQEKTDQSVRALNYEKLNTERTQQGSNRASARNANAQARVTEIMGVANAKADMREKNAKANYHVWNAAKAVADAHLSRKKAETEVENKKNVIAKTGLTNVQTRGQEIENEWAPKMYRSQRLKNTGSFIKDLTGSITDVSKEARGWVFKQAPK